MAKFRNANGFGSISKLSGNRRRPWIARKTIGYDENGKQIMEIIGYYSKYPEAMQALLEYNASLVNGVNVNGYTFKAIYEAYTEDRYTKLGKPIPNAYSKSYERCTSLQELSFNSIKLKQLEDIIEATPTPSTKNNVKTLFTQMYKYALKHEITTKNVASGLEMAKSEKSDIHKPFTEDELKILWKHKEELGAKLWLLYCYTGMRPSEILSISLDNVHLKEQYMLGGIKNESSKNRVIPIADSIKSIVEYFFNSGKEYLYSVDNKKGYHDIKDTLDEFNEKYKINHLPHDGRHTMATRLDEAGVPLTTIQKILGHKSAGGITSKVYIHKTVKVLLDAVNLLPAY